MLQKRAKQRTQFDGSVQHFLPFSFRYYLFVVESTFKTFIHESKFNRSSSRFMNERLNLRNANLFFEWPSQLANKSTAPGKWIVRLETSETLNGAKWESFRTTQSTYSSLLEYKGTRPFFTSCNYPQPKVGTQPTSFLVDLLVGQCRIVRTKCSSFCYCTYRKKVESTLICRLERRDFSIMHWSCSICVK